MLYQSRNCQDLRSCYSFEDPRFSTQIADLLKNGTELLPQNLIIFIHYLKNVPG